MIINLIHHQAYQGCGGVSRGIYLFGSPRLPLQACRGRRIGIYYDNKLNSPSDAPWLRGAIRGLSDKDPYAQLGS
jgi:hypothetical protein